jgi:isoleucyl-tRNA synthetase
MHMQTKKMPFQPLEDKPDYPALELQILETWERERTFDRLREQNRGGPAWSLIDGPVTANKRLGVHTAWGRTLKDVFQRYKALRGFDQRYQNGFDCEGLWIEVGVERQLGLNSKKEIEEYGLEAFAKKCREVVVWSANELWRGSKRLGQWMDWGNDYFTFSDTNIEYIWRFLKIVHERGWLYRGHRPTEWCPRCGTSISAHELAGSYVDRADPSLYVRFRLRDRKGESLVIWTTTPWTLPANVAAALNAKAAYGRRANGEWVAVACYPDESFVEEKVGSDLVGLRYEGPFDDLAPGKSVDHRVIPWSEVDLTEGTGIVHIAPGCGAEDFELARVHDLPILTPVDGAGRFLKEYGWLHGLSTVEAAEQIIGNLEERGRLVESGLYEHRYPECWRCHTPLIFCIADDWFISAQEVREDLRRANAEVSWTPEYFGKRMDDWLVNMGDWNISRRRYYGLPLPFYPCDCGHLTVIGCREELEELAISGLGQLQELRRPWIDRVPVRCKKCGQPVQRILEVGDVWLDAGIVPFSTLGWQNPTRRESGYATGASRGLSKADLPDHAYWERWFPADLVCEMREQIRLWFYSQLFMSVTLVGRPPFRQVVGYEKMLDEHGLEMHGSHGNMIEAEDAFARMGADVMRWQFSAQPPDRNLLFGYGPAHDIKRRLLTLWHSYKFFIDYANIEDFGPRYETLTTGPRGASQTIDRWIIARTSQLVRQATEAYEAFLTHRVIDEFDAFLEDLSTWYIRRTRRRFWQGDEAALETLWYCLVQAIRVIAPVLPFLTEHLWRNVVGGACAGAADSVFLAGWPVAVAVADDTILAEVAEARQVVELGRRARAAGGLKVRQPLRRAYVRGAALARSQVDHIQEELNVKEVVLDGGPMTQAEYKPNLSVLGPRLGARLRPVLSALASGDFEELTEGRIRVAGEVLGPDGIIRGDLVQVEGYTFAANDNISVALDTSLDQDLLLEGRARDLVRQVNQMRKEHGLDLTDRIVLTLTGSDAELVERYGDWIRKETLALELTVGSEPAIEKAHAAGPGNASEVAIDDRPQRGT